MMKKNLLDNLKRTFKTGLIAFVLIMAGVCLWNGNGSECLAADTAVQANEYGYFKKQYEISDYKTAVAEEYTSFPMLTEEDGIDYQDWLFAGWYQNENCTVPVEQNTISGIAYAKFVHADVLSIKCQILEETQADSYKTNMRILSTVDSLAYREVGFVVRRGSVQKTYPATTVYKRINAHEYGNEIGYNPTAFHETSKYFLSFNLTNIGNANFDNPFYLRAYWITPDGTRVYGVDRYARVEDGYLNIVNVPVWLNADASVTEGSVTVDYTCDNAELFELYTTDDYPGYDQGKVFSNVNISNDSANKKVTITATKEETAVFAKGIFVNLRFQLKANTMPSVSNFVVESSEFKNGDDTVNFNFSNIKFRNFPVTYTGEVDTSWYWNTDKDTYALASAADLYGFAQLVNDGKTFVGETVYLVADITVNEGDPEEDNWGTTAPDYEWTPIGYDKNKRFNGTFDGQMCTISGLYLKDDSNMAEAHFGLFGITQTKCVIQNLRLEDSYFESVIGWDNDKGTSTFALMGSVVGQLCGKMDTVYSNATVVSANRHVGGLIGRTNPGATGTSTVNNCWFDGKLTVTRSAMAANELAGGIVGNIVQGTLVMSNCLNAGDVTYIYTTETSGAQIGVGGLVGGMGGKHTLNISSSLNVGTISAKSTADVVYTTGVGSVYGLNRKTTTLTNVYTTEESCANAGYDSTSDTVTSNLTESGAVTIQAESKYIGQYGYDNAFNLGYNTDGHKGIWVTRETAADIGDCSPALLSFVKHWTDVEWYYKKLDDTLDDYVLTTTEELCGLSDLSRYDDFNGKTVYLGANIEVSEGNAAMWAAGTTTARRVFTPIGQTKTFRGKFDGSYNGIMHTISGLYVDGSISNYVGLFGQVRGTVKNFYLKNSYIESTKNYTGSVAGFLSGNLTNIYSEAIVESSATDTGGLVGRFGAGYDTNARTISNCWFNGKVSGSKNNIGGIVGCIPLGAKTVSNCLTTGTVEYKGSGTSNIGVGGVIGRIKQESDSLVATTPRYATIVRLSDCFGKATMEGISGRTGADYAIGYVEACTSTTISDTYIITSTGKTIPGVGNTALGSSKVVSYTITGQPAVIIEGELTGENAYIYAELDFYESSENPNGVWAAIEDGTPVIKSLYEGVVMEELDAMKIRTDWYFNNTNRSYEVGGSTSLEDQTPTYYMDDESDFYGLSRLVNNQPVAKTGNTGTNFNGKTVELTANVDFNEGWDASSGKTPVNEWTPIGSSNSISFYGNFDGNLHTIRGLYVDAVTRNNGLFGYTRVGSMVQSLRIENSYFHSTDRNLGSVVGVAKGSLNEVYSNAILVGEHEATGGIVGIYSGTKGTDGTEGSESITNCWFDGMLTTSGIYAGGIAGRIYEGKKTVENCLNTGVIENTCEEIIYEEKEDTSEGDDGEGSESAGDSTEEAVGEVRQVVYTGGLIGAIQGGSSNTPNVTLNNCLSNGEVRSMGRSAVGSVVGRIISATEEGIYIENTPVVAVTMKNVYSTNSLTCLREGVSIDQSTNTEKGLGNVSLCLSDVTGLPVILTEEELTGNNSYLYTNLEFSSTETPNALWIVSEEGMPELKSFSNETGMESAGGQRVDVSWYYNNIAYLLDLDAYETNDGYKKILATETLSIANLDEFLGFEKIVNTDGKTFSGIEVCLNDDIEVNDGLVKEWEEGTVPEIALTPIGTNSVRFRGSFNGNNHTISGVYIDSTASYVGLFGVINDATIRNLRLENAYIKGMFDAESNPGTSSRYLGSIAGSGYGHFENVYSDATIVSNHPYTGGIIGRVYNSDESTETTMTSCWYSGKVLVDYRGDAALMVGGLIGESDNGAAVVDTCLYDGDITITLISEVEGQNNYGMRVGGICGGDDAEGWLVVKNSFSAGSINAAWNNNPDFVYSENNCPKTIDFVASILGYAYNVNSVTSGSVYATTEMTTTVEYVNTTQTVTDAHDGPKTDEGRTFDASKFIVDTSWTGLEENLYGLGSQVLTELVFVETPELPIWAAQSGKLLAPATLVSVEDVLEIGVGKADISWYAEEEKVDNAYVIDSVEDLFGFAVLSQSTTFVGETIQLGQNITIGAELPWYQIGSFAGTFDGCGYTISGIYLNQNVEYVSMFAETVEGSEIKDLTIADSYFNPADNTTNVLVGNQLGTITNVTVSDTVVKEGKETE